MTYDEMLDKYLRKLGRDITAGEVVYDLRHFELDRLMTEVVRCIDCEFRNGEKKGFCYGIERYTNDFDFCSRGIRKGTVKPDDV